MRSPIKWFGGKSLLAERIVARIPEHTCYVEVFGGAGWVLFRKDRSKSEIYNDLNGDLVNLFSVLRDRLPEFTTRAEFLIPNREEFYRARNEPREELNPIERALRFYTLIHHSFNCNLRQYKPIRTRAPAAVNLDLLRDASKRLQKVWIEKLDFEALIKKYDGPDTCFYLDPPYAPPAFASGVYGWPDSEHDRLKRVLSEVKGRYIMSYPGWPRFRDLYADHHIEAIPTRYRSFIRDGKHRFVDELLISNYDTATVSPLVRPGFVETVVDPDELLT
jgi:DNA adenine methylase